MTGKSRREDVCDIVIYLKINSLQHLPIPKRKKDIQNLINFFCNYVIKLHLMLYEEARP
jgi:hypothetical protein